VADGVCLIWVLILFSMRTVHFSMTSPRRMSRKQVVQGRLSNRKNKNHTSMENRSLEIDSTKGLLAIGMIFAHTIQVLGRGDSQGMFYFQLLTNLVSFPGFLFCFGFAHWTAYLSKPAIPWGSVLRTAVKCYGAFVLSGFAFRIFYSKEPASLVLLAQIALIQDLSGYSDFLIAFAYITIIAAVCAVLVRAATSGWGGLAIAATVSVAASLLPWSEVRLHIPSLFRTPLAVIFDRGLSVLPYSMFFIGGVYSARHRLHLNPFVVFICFIATAIFFALTHADINIQRFPVSVGWLAFSSAIVLVYFYIGSVVVKIHSKPFQQYILGVGHCTLLYLIVSNFLLFALKGTGVIGTLEWSSLPIAFLGIMATIYFIQYISAPSRR
jgi:hypothetical protein